MILQTLSLDDGSTFDVTGETWAAFGEAYRRSDDNEDHHGTFAELIDQDRDIAKEIVFRMMYTNTITHKLINSGAGE